MKRNCSVRREKIFDALRSAITHPTAEWIYEQVKQDIPELSLGTVYRNLRILVDEGRARVIHGEGGKDHFDGFVEPHHHLICQGCGQVIDYYSSKDDGFIQKVEEETGFSITETGLRFVGLCRMCRDKNPET